MTFNEWYVDTEFNPMIYGALEAAWNAAVTAEREECVKCVELVRDDWVKVGANIKSCAAGYLAHAIRARNVGEQP